MEHLVSVFFLSGEDILSGFWWVYVPVQPSQQKLLPETKPG